MEPVMPIWRWSLAKRSNHRAKPWPRRVSTGGMIARRSPRDRGFVCVLPSGGVVAYANQVKQAVLG